MGKKTLALANANAFMIEKQLAQYATGTIIKIESPYRSLIKLYDKVKGPPRKSNEYISMVTSGPRPSPQASHWLVLDVVWEPDECYLWIEVLSFGESRQKGWIKDPDTVVRRIEL